MGRRSRTPIFNALAARYTTRGGWVSDSPESWALGAFMRGFTYGLVLQDTLRPPEPERRRERFPEPWHHTYPSPWDAIDAVPNEHHPDL